MNKLLQKLAKIFLGLSMAAGVGVAIGAGRKDASPVHAEKITSYSNIVSGADYYIGATTSGTDYYLSVDGSTTSTSRAGTAVTNKGSATVFTFTGSGTSWTIKFKDYSNYLGLKNGKDNGKVQVVSSAATFTASNQSSKIRLSIGSYSIQKNNTTTNFGSYGNTMTDLFLETAATNYTVHFNGNGNTSGSMSDASTAGSEYITPLTTGFAKTDYYLSKWALNSAGGTQYNPGSKITGISGDITLYAIWSLGNKVTYTVTSTTAVSSSGTTPTGSTASYSQTYGTASQITSGNSITLTLSGYQGKSITAASVSVKSNASKGGGSLSLVSGSSTIASIENSKFNTDNWNGAWSVEYVVKSLTVTSTTIASNATIVLTISATESSLYFESLSLIWETPALYTVSFNANNSDYSGSTPGALTQASAGASITLPAALSCTGYDWLGWNTSSSGGQSTRKAAGSSYTPTSSHTLYGEWQLKSYTIDGSGITGGTLSSSANINHGDSLDIYLVPSTNYTLPDSITLTMGGATLVEDTDYTYDDLTESNPGEITILEVTGDIVITAACVPVGTAFTVTYNANSGSVSPSSEEIIENGHPSFPTPTRSGYNFKGWQVNGSGTAYFDSEDYTVTGDVTFVALWAAVYTVTFNANGGSSTPESQSVESGSTFTFPAAPGTKTHYSFDGWTSTGDEPYYAAGATSPAVSGNITYTAHWTEDAKYTVTYSAASPGSGSYAHANNYGGTYTLLEFASLSGITYDSSTYRFKDYTVDGVSRAPGYQFTLSSAKTITVNFEVKPLETTYNFVTNFATYASDWPSSYSTHEGVDGKTDIGGAYSATIDFYKASKQGSTMEIHTMPVIANQNAADVYEKVLCFTLTESGYEIDELTVTFVQWGDKTPQVALYSGNEISGSALDSGTIGTKNTLSATNFGGYSFSIGFAGGNTSKNTQVGLQSIYIKLRQATGLSSVTTSGQTVTFDDGDNFAYNGTLTAHYYGAADATVTPTSFHIGSAGGTAITTSDTLDRSTHNNAVIYVVYTEGGKTASCHYTITVNEPHATSITASVSKTFYVGETITTSDITVEDNLGNTIVDFEFASNNYKFVYADSNPGGTAKTKTFTNEITAGLLTCSLSVTVQRTAPIDAGSVSDTLTYESIGVTGTGYSTWTGMTDSSDAVYAGNSAGGNTSIQLRSGTSSGSNVHSGIISTSSGGKLTKVEVVWNSHTSGKVIDVYGSNSAYSNANDLYSSGTQGTKLGSITEGSTTELTISGDYTYVGIRSNSGALYIDSVTFTYGADETAKNIANFIMYNDTEGQCNAKLDQAITKLNNLTQAELDKFSGYTLQQDYVIATARERLNAWATSKGKTIDYSTAGHVAAGSAVYSVLKTLNKNTNTVAIIVIISMVSVTAIGGYFFLRKRKENI